MTSPLKTAIVEARKELQRLEALYAPLTTAVVVAAAPDDERLEALDSIHMIEWIFRAEQLQALTAREAVEFPTYVSALHRSTGLLTTALEPDFALAA